MKVKRFFCSILVLITAFVFSGCDRFHGYKGDNYDLFTVAINSLLGSKGAKFMDPDGPELEIIEQDEYGRIMFSYYENNSFSTYSLLISQKTENDFVYYYPDYNFISNADGNFTEEEIATLKANNDWNLQLNDLKMISNNIVDKKIEPKIDEEIFEDAAKELLNMEYNFKQYCASDSYGKSLYIINVINRDVDSSKNFDYVIILSADLTYNQNSIMKLKKNNNYQDDLKTLKELNNWNKDA